MNKIIILIVFSISLLTAQESGHNLAKKLKIYPASKASNQWKKIFDTPHRLKRYKIDTLSTQEQKILKEYLINHAADSDLPQMAGFGF